MVVRQFSVVMRVRDKTLAIVQELLILEPTTDRLHAETVLERAGAHPATVATRDLVADYRPGCVISVEMIFHPE